MLQPDLEDIDKNKATDPNRAMTRDLNETATHALLSLERAVQPNRQDLMY